MANYGELSFYNKRNTAEIDIILNQKYGFEVKLNGTSGDVIRYNTIGQKIGISKVYVITKKYNQEKGMLFPMFI